MREFNLKRGVSLNTPFIFELSFPEIEIVLTLLLSKLLGRGCFGKKEFLNVKSSGLIGVAF